MTTTKTSHTPGPWTVSSSVARRDREFYFVSMRAPRPRVFTPAVAWGSDADEAKANAKLIAAAPDLLRACELALGALGPGFPGSSNNVAIKTLKDAISKARA